MIRAVMAVALVLGAFHASHVAAKDAGVGPPSELPPSAEQEERININVAGVQELVRLPGIGPSRAEAIIAEREKRRFRRIEDILRVPGIGRKTFGRIRHSIRVR